MFEINTSANFEAAHRLSNYDGKYNRIHGHNWKVNLKVQSNELDEKSMVYDFTNLKKILEEFDHKTILKNTKENQELVKSFPSEWITWLNFEPTAEELAKYICNKITSKINLKLIQITIFENEKSYAIFEQTQK